MRGSDGMIAALVAALLSCALAALLTPFVRRLALGIGALDVPGGRHVHVAATPRLGGVAMVLAYMTAVLGCERGGLLGNVIPDRPAFWAFLGGGLLIAVTGAIDDVRAIGAKKKLLVQWLVATIAWTGGARVLPTLVLPGLGPVHIGAVASYALTVVWVLAFINAINLIDGLDGLAGGVVFFATITNITVALVTQNTFALVLNAALGGAVLGFLFYNFNPATIFMGDVGSMFLGYALGTSALMTSAQKESTLASLLAPVIALGIPFADTLLAMVRRFLARRSIFSADRGHFHHRLLDLGLTPRRAVLVLYACSVVLCVAAIGAAVGRRWQVGAAIVAAILVLIAITRFAGYFQLILLRQQQAPLLSGPTDPLRRALPRLVLDLAQADSVAAVWAATENLLVHGPFVFAEFQPSDMERVAWRWEKDIDSRNDKALLAPAFRIRVYPGGAQGVLRFGLLSDEPQLLPQAEILLQIVSDSLEAALIRLHVRAPIGLVRAVVPS